MYIQLFRHFESQANIKGHVCYDYDSELSVTGQNQIHKLKFNRLENYDKIISSPLKRAVQTADLVVNKYNLDKYEISDRVKERVVSSKFSNVSKQTLKSIRDANNHIYTSLTQDWEGVSDVEQDKEITDRFYKEIAYIEEDSKILIFTHAGFIHAVIKELFGLSHNYFKIRNGTLVELHKQGSKFVLNQIIQLQ